MKNVHLGIDLGTSNSAQAVFDGERVELLRTSDGSVLTPSVVRIDAKGRLTVGSKARARLVDDPENTRTEFKRLMGSGHRLDFPAARVTRAPEELAAEVLKSLRADFQEQLGFAPLQAVISVPALFELPQIAKTSEAARLAGFERVEFIQEPIASAIAAGWSAENDSGAWLVYDLGGGTFDVSLLESREGLLRVVGHDGDNFLGGRDIDQAIVDWVLAHLAEEGSVLDVRDPSLAPAFRRLRAACENAKIELTRAREVDLELEGLVEKDGRSIDVELRLSREQFDALLTPIVDRSIAVCERLLSANGLRADQIEKVLLIGGPTVIPALRERVASGLNVPLATGHDPMTLVAHGAALFAASHGIIAKADSGLRPASLPDVWLQYPAVCSDTEPFVIGKVGLANGGDRIRAIRIDRKDGGFSEGPVELDEERSFAVPVALKVRTRSLFQITGIRDDGTTTPLHPAELAIVHGVSIGDPPLSRTIGVATANDEVHVFFERGSPLPARRTFTLRTVETITPGHTGFALQIPIVQGEAPFAHLCRQVGALEIRAEEIRASVPAGRPVEITLELDRAGGLTASARIASIDQSFRHVAKLVVPDIEPEAMRNALLDLASRVAEVRASAFRASDPKIVRSLLGVDTQLRATERAVELAVGGDLDAREQARRGLNDLEITISEAEAELVWPKLQEETGLKLAMANYWVSQYGTDAERQLFQKTWENVERALRTRSGSTVRKQLKAAFSLADVCYLRDPEAWSHQLDYAKSRLPHLSDPMQGKRLVDQGEKARERGDREGLERAIRALWQLFPADEEERRLAFGSGVR